MPLTPLPETITGGQSGHLAHHNDIHARLNDMANIEVYDKVVTTIVEALDITTIVGITEFDVSTAASGQRWVVSYNLIYQASTAGGIFIRNKIGAPGATTTDWTITGEWNGITTATTAPTGLALRETFSRADPVRYRAGVASVGREFGGLGANVDVPLRGEFRIEINGSALADRVVGIEFSQANLDSVTSTKIMPGSYAVISRTV